MVHSKQGRTTASKYGSQTLLTMPCSTLQCCAVVGRQRHQQRKRGPARKRWSIEHHRQVAQKREINSPKVVRRDRQATVTAIPALRGAYSLSAGRGPTDIFHWLQFGACINGDVSIGDSGTHEVAAGEDIVL